MMDNNYQPLSKPIQVSHDSFSGAKEQEKSGKVLEPEKVVYQETKEPGLPQEVSGWVEKLPTAEEIQLPQPVVDDFGQVLVQSSAPRQQKITLPLTTDQLKFGLREKVISSLRWLAEWCLRLIKMGRGQTVYNQKAP
jgi:hypothetical protein